MKKPRSRDRLGIGFLTVGCLFLIDPFIGSFEILPDLVGAIFFLAGSHRLALIEPRIELFRKKSVAFFWLSLLRIAVAVGTALPALLGTGTEFLSGLEAIFDPTMRLTFSFSFAVLDCIILIPAFLSLFEGLDYVYLRNRPEETEQDSDSPALRSVRTLTVVFLTVRAFIGFAPMLTATGSEYGTVGDEPVSYETLYVVLTVFCCLIALVIGIAWLSSIKPYFAFFAEDEAWESVMAERLEREIYADEYQENRRHAAFLSSTMTASSVLLLSVPFSSRYLFPEFLFGLLAVWAFWGIRRFTDEKRLCRLGIGFAISALIEYVVTFVYSEWYGVRFEPTRLAGFWGLYLPTVLLWGISSVLLALLFYRLYRTLCAFIGDAVGIRSGTESEKRQQTDRGRKRELCRKAGRLWLFQCLFAVLRAAAFAASPWLSASWVAPFLAGLVLIFYTYWVTKEIADETEMAI
ncbi:MAG: hypothetical protein KBS76_03920 [Ruminococcus sp.]|nr:hypothetical protein [Candidatus Apopatosoma intestinale]